MVEHRVSNSQLEELLDHLANHPNLAKGIGLGARSKEDVDKEWSNIAKKLNSHGSGASKSGQRWKRYWIDLKHKVKSRAAVRRKEASGTGGGPAVEEALSEIDTKVLNIMGEGAVYGDTQHRIPLFPDLQTASTSKKPNIGEIDSGIHLNVTETIQDKEHQSMELSPIRNSRDDKQDVEQLQSKVIQIYTLDESFSELLPVHENPQENIEKAASGTRKRKYKPAAIKHQKIEPNWVIELERKRVAAEEKLSDAAVIIAEATRTQAEAALITANAAKMQAEAAMLQAQAISGQADSLIKILQELKK